MKGKNKMNKLMIAASAALCAAVSFGEGITSSNVVGYNSFTSPEDATEYFVGSFDNVTTGGKIKLNQIKPDDLWDYSWGDYIATLSPVGLQDEYFTYVDGEWYAADGIGGYSGEPISERELDVNVGLLVYSYNGAALVFSGAVAKGDCELNVVEDATAYSGNFSPADLKIGDIVPDDNWDYSWGDYIATLNAVGLQEAYYTYVDGDWYVADGIGGYSGDPVNETVVFPANKCFLTYSYNGASVSFPSPLK